MRVEDVRHLFVQKLLNRDFTPSRDGSKTIEILGASFCADEPAIFGTPNQEYIDLEIEWYRSQSTNVFDIGMDPIPKAWITTANQYGEINSNYGHLIYSEKYYRQFDRVVQELLSDQYSRRATMVYTRPSIWVEYNENGKSDFICTNAVTYYIRDHKVHACVQMRSNDSWAGYRNDYAFQRYVLQNIVFELRARSLSNVVLEPGDIFWQVQNLHMYSRNFYLIDAYNKGIPSITKKEYANQFPESEYLS